MAEFLIMRQNYWSQLGGAESIVKLGDKKFNRGVHRPYDVCISEDDGYHATNANPKGHGWNRIAYYLLIVEGTTKQFTKHYTEPFMKDGAKVYRHRWTMEDLSVAQKADLESPLTDSKMDAADMTAVIKAKT